MSVEPDVTETEALERALLTMDRVAAARIVAGAAWPADAVIGVHAARVPAVPLTRIDALLVPALRSIGDAWVAGNVALSQVYMAARISEEIVDRVDKDHQPVRLLAPRIGLATLEDRHELGKRLVAMNLRVAGYAVHDYGAGNSVDDLIRVAEEDELDILFVSTLMLRSVFRVEVLAGALARRSVRPKLIVGGAPYLFDVGLWREMGADAMGHSASDAITHVEALVPGLPGPPMVTGPDGGAMDTSRPEFVS